MKHLILLSLISIFFLTGCATIENRVYLQELDVTTPLNIPPVYLTTAASKERGIFSPKFYINNAPDIHGTVSRPPVNSQGYYQVDTVDGSLIRSNSNVYPGRGDNLRWTMPDLVTGFDLSFPLGSTFSINTGVNISSANNETLLGGALGFSLSTAVDNAGIRFSTGFNIQQFRYEALTIVESTVNQIFGSSRTYVYYYNDEGKGTNFNFYLSLLANSDIPDYPVNFFMGVSYFRQTIAEFEPRQLNNDLFPFVFTSEIDARGEYSTSFFGFSPGLYKDLGEGFRLVGGANFLLGLKSITNASQTSFIMPFVKIEFIL